MSGSSVSWAAAIINPYAFLAAQPIVEGYGQYQEAKSEARTQEANAMILRENARRKRLETAMNEDTLRRENRQKVARSLAATIENGGGGSPTSIGALGQQATTLEQNALNLRYEGLSQAENMDINAYYYDQKAKETKRAGKNAFKMSLLKSGIKAASAYFTAGASEGVAAADGIYTAGGTSATTVFY